MNKIVFSIFFICLLVLSGLSFSSVSSEETIRSTGTTLYVDDDGTADYTKIQDAINASSDGDTVFVYNGTYNGTILINKEITLEGEDNENTIITGEEDKDVIDINSNNVLLMKFKIISKGIGNTIELSQSAYSIIENNICISDVAGILISESFNNEISNNFFINNSIGFVQSDHNDFSENNLERSSLFLASSNDNIITRNVIDKINKFGDGITTSSGSENNLITYNSIKNCNRAVCILSYGFNTISYNDFFSNKWNAFILNTDCTWHHNYWGRPKILPKIIFHMDIIGYYFGFNQYPVYFDVDWRPALKPNCEDGGVL